MNVFDVMLCSLTGKKEEEKGERGKCSSYVLGFQGNSVRSVTFTIKNELH